MIRRTREASHKAPETIAERGIEVREIDIAQSDSANHLPKDEKRAFVILRVVRLEERRRLLALRTRDWPSRTGAISISRTIKYPFRLLFLGAYEERFARAPYHPCRQGYPQPPIRSRCHAWIHLI